ncbi:MAG: putative endonuclease [Limisphaerales bacterium]|jgi:putative endonuclease
MQANSTWEAIPDTIISSQELGKLGEKLAARYLTNKGFTFLASNYRSGRLEIDLIFRTKNYITFVEVKTRTGDYLPELAVTSNKQKRVIKAALNWLSNNPSELEIQFDIIAIRFKAGKFLVLHLEDAFYPGL